MSIKTPTVESVSRFDDQGFLLSAIRIRWLTYISIATSGFQFSGGESALQTKTVGTSFNLCMHSKRRTTSYKIRQIAAKLKKSLCASTIREARKLGHQMMKTENSSPKFSIQLEKSAWGRIPEGLPQPRRRRRPLTEQTEGKLRKRAHGIAESSSERVGKNVY